MEKCLGLQFLLETQGNLNFKINFIRIKDFKNAFNVTSFPTIVFVEAKSGNYELVLLDGASLIQRCHGEYVVEVLSDVYDPIKGEHEGCPEWKRYGKI
jgi:hypothetical protein